MRSWARTWASCQSAGGVAAVMAVLGGATVVVVVAIVFDGGTFGVAGKKEGGWMRYLHVI